MASALPWFKKGKAIDECLIFRTDKQIRKLEMLEKTLPGLKTLFRKQVLENMLNYQL